MMGDYRRETVTEERVDCSEGKYTVTLRSDGTSEALRYGEPWPAYPSGLNNLEAALARDLIDARAALSVALSKLIKYEPGHSRAVSDEFVAMAAVEAGIANDEARQIISAAADTKVRLAECQPGLFLFNGTLGFKTEYGATDAYCVPTGETFWGGTSRAPDRANLMVQPIDLDSDQFRHLKRGSVYWQMGRGELQTKRPLVEGDDMVAYMGEDGRIWFRSTEEFDDGRFERLTVPGGSTNG